MTTHLTLSLRAQALAARFGPVYYDEFDDGCGARTFIDDVTVYVDVIGDQLSVYIYEHGERRPLLRLSGVQDDDLFEYIIRQVIDDHNGKQVV